MRRTRAWWARLSAGERSELVALERADACWAKGSGAYLPEGYSECNYCSTPGQGPLCNACLWRLVALTAKGDGEEA